MSAHGHVVQQIEKIGGNVERINGSYCFNLMVKKVTLPKCQVNDVF